VVEGRPPYLGPREDGPGSFEGSGPLQCSWAGCRNSFPLSHSGPLLCDSPNPIAPGPPRLKRQPLLLSASLCACTQKTDDTLRTAVPQLRTPTAADRGYRRYKIYAADILFPRIVEFSTTKQALSPRYKVAAGRQLLESEESLPPAGPPL
jgi:hypothetical protein